MQREEPISFDLELQRCAPSYGKGLRADEFDQLAHTHPTPQLVAALAQAHAHEDVHLLDAVEGADCLRLDGGPVRRVATYYHRLGTGGAEKVTLELLDLWRSMGYEVLALCDEGTLSQEYARQAKVQLVELPGFEESMRGSFEARASALQDALVSNHIDVLVYSQWTSPSLAWDLLTARLCGVATVVFSHASCRVLTTYCQPAYLRLPGVMRHASAVVCLGAEDEGFWGLFHSHVFRTPNRVGGEFFPRRREGDERPTVMWVGRISTDKSPWDALEAFALVRRQVPEARLVMVGPFGNLGEDEARQLVERLGIADAVEFRGELAHDQLPAALAEADVYLLTSHAEGYCISLGEAKAMGIPCVTYDLTNLTLLEGSRGVRKAPLGNVELMAQEVVRLLEDEELRCTCGDEGRAHMLELAGFDYAALWREVFSCAEEPFVVPTEGAVASWMMADTGMRSQLVQNDRDDKYAQLVQAQHELEGQRSALADVEGSVSFKAGRALTAPARAIRAALHR